MMGFGHNVFLKHMNEVYGLIYAKGTEQEGKRYFESVHDKGCWMVQINVDAKEILINKRFYKDPYSFDSKDIKMTELLLESILNNTEHWEEIFLHGYRHCKYVIKEVKDDNINVICRYTMTENIPSIRRCSTDVRDVIVDLINDYIQIEKKKTGLDYQQQNNFKMGQINAIASLIGEKWDFHETGQCYYDFLKYLVRKYKLSGVSEINDL